LQGSIGLNRAPTQSLFLLYICLSSFVLVFLFHTLYRAAYLKAALYTYTLCQPERSFLFVIGVGPNKGPHSLFKRYSFLQAFCPTLIGFLTYYLYGFPLYLRSGLPTAKYCSCGTFLHFSLQIRLLNICYCHQDLH